MARFLEAIWEDFRCRGPGELTTDFTDGEEPLLESVDTFRRLVDVVRSGVCAIGILPVGSGKDVASDGTSAWVRAWPRGSFSCTTDFESGPCTHFPLATRQWHSAPGALPEEKSNEIVDAIVPRLVALDFENTHAELKQITQQAGKS